MAYAMKLLSYRARSMREVELRLSEKGYGDDVVTVVIGSLSNEGYIDDERFARELADSRLRNKNWGAVKIASELRSKGLAMDIIDAVTGSIDEETELAAAKRAFSKWLRRCGLDNDNLEKSQSIKAARHLAQRGFSSSVVRRTIYSDQDDL